jgi:hypothetical protein
LRKEYDRIVEVMRMKEHENDSFASSEASTQEAIEEYVLYI